MHGLTAACTCPEALSEAASLLVPYKGAACSTLLADPLEPVQQGTSAKRIIRNSCNQSNWAQLVGMHNSLPVGAVR